jgi:RimJ/RimL family protein N-acetyltransferase
MLVRIETDRLLLREYVQSDWEQVHEYSSDPEVVRFMLWGPNSEDQTRNFVARAIGFQREEPRHQFEVAVVLKDTGKVIGGIGLRIKSERRKEADLGYCYSREAWGKGYGSEAAQSMLRFGFEKLHMHRIWATCDAENRGSAGVMKKCGMRHEAHFKQDELIKGQWRDSLLYAILEDEWLGLHSAAVSDAKQKS